MDYREWGHGSRDPLDGLARQSNWEDDEYEQPPQRDPRADDRERNRRDSWQTGTGWVTVQPQGEQPEPPPWQPEPPPWHPEQPAWEPEPPAVWRPEPPVWQPDPVPVQRPPAPPPREPQPRYPAPAPPADWYDQQWYEPPDNRLPVPRRAAEMLPLPRPAPEPPPRVRSRPRQRSRYRRDDDGPMEGRGYFWTALMTVIWYVVPVALYIVWALLLGGTPEPNCLDPAGNPCGSPRAEALETLVQTMPRLGTALALSVVIAIVMRWANTTWRAVTIGFASSVVGAGIATVLFTVIGPTPS